MTAEHNKQTSRALLGFERRLWDAADRMRGHRDPAEYKHIALGLIFLKYISDVFQERFVQIQGEPYADLEDRETTRCWPSSA